MTSDNIREQINAIMELYNSSIQIEYFPAQTISPATISSLIAKMNEHPSKRTVKAVYIDYLDLYKEYKAEKSQCITNEVPI